MNYELLIVEFLLKVSRLSCRIHCTDLLQRVIAPIEKITKAIDSYNIMFWWRLMKLKMKIKGLDLESNPNRIGKVWNYESSTSSSNNEYSDSKQSLDESGPSVVQE